MIRIRLHCAPVVRLLLPVCTGVLMLCSLTPAHAVDAEKPRLFALIVGVSAYENRQIRPLRYAAKDARDVVSFIKEKQKQRELFSDVSVQLLVNDQARRSAIAEALGTGFGAAKADDIVIIYLSGHGESDLDHPENYYFVPYDADPDRLAATGLLMNDPNLLKGIRSERLLLVADSCKSGGFISDPTLARQGKGPSREPAFAEIRGCFGLSSAGPYEIALDLNDFRQNGLFTYYFIKGLRGEAAAKKSDGIITVKGLYDYLLKRTKEEAEKLGATQTPQLHDPAGLAEFAPLYLTERFDTKLNINVKFFYLGDHQQLTPLTNDSVLRSGQRLGLAFKPDADCYVHIFWWDSSGQVGRLFPNPHLTEGTGEVKAGQAVWLPSKREKRWYVLDAKPGTETIYFVASRYRNHKLEELFEQLKRMAPETRAGASGKSVADQIEREVNLMGFADHTEAVGAGAASREKQDTLAEALEGKLTVHGAEAFYKVRFKHLP